MHKLLNELTDMTGEKSAVIIGAGIGGIATAVYLAKNGYNVNVFEKNSQRDKFLDIFNLYLMVFERIDVKNGKFTTEELNPSPEETRERVYKTIMKFELA